MCCREEHLKSKSTEVCHLLTYINVQMEVVVVMLPPLARGVQPQLSKMFKLAPFEIASSTTAS